MENGEKSFHKLLDIWELVASGTKPRSVNEIADALKLPESTVYRILKCLIRRNYIERTPGGVLLGSGCLHLGVMAQEQNLLPRLAHSELMKLADATLETVHLAKFHGDSVLYIDKFEGGRSIRMGSMVGRSSPLHCTGIGKAMLSALSDKELRERLPLLKLERFTETTICDPDALFSELLASRQRGYAIDDCEHEQGVYCIAAPVTDRNGKVVAGLSIAGLSLNLKPNTESLAQKVCAAAAAISAKL